MPEDVLRYLDHVRLMDERLQEAMNDWSKHRKEYLEVSQSPDPHADKLQRLQTQLHHEEELIKQFAGEKIASARQAETLVEANLGRLGEVLDKLKGELADKEARGHDLYEPVDRSRRRRNEPTLTYGEPDYIGMEGDLTEMGGGDKEVYCTCGRVFDGEMVGCENPDVCFTQCKIKWFHFECVGLKKAPEGDWYCSSCQPGN